ncbi:hypothetical protein A2U01_0035252, partial [Trifolium medium]|nr:hypothetical protein [Trifolium medium]
SVHICSDGSNPVAIVKLVSYPPCPYCATSALVVQLYCNSAGVFGCSIVWFADSAQDSTHLVQLHIAQFF